MPRTVTFNGVTHTFPDDATDDEISAALETAPEQQSPVGPPASNTAPQRANARREAIAGSLPSAGGLVGSLVGQRFGKPGAVAGAALGGAAGQGYGELLRHAGEFPGAALDVARNLVTEPGATIQGAVQGAKEGLANAAAAGAIQGGLEGVGQYAITPFAKGLYATSMRPLKALRTKYGLGKLITEGFEQRILP